MIKKLLFGIAMLLIAGLAITPAAHAIFASGSAAIEVRRETSPGSNVFELVDQLNPIKTGDLVEFTVGVQNVSRDTVLGPNLYPAILCNTTTETEICSIPECTDISLILERFQYVKCDIIDSGVASCAPVCPSPFDPADSGCNKVLITMDPCVGCPTAFPPTGGVAFGIGQAKELVKIYKKALKPIPQPEFYSRVNSGINDLLAYNPATQACVTGGAQGSTPSYYPPVPKICVTKDCTPIDGCFPGEITFFGQITNCGEDELVNIGITDDKGTIDPLICPDPLEPGQSCSYTGKYAPGAPGASTDTVTATATGAVTQRAVSAQDSATCTLTPDPGSVTLVKQCVDAATTNDPIDYTLTVKNTGVGACAVPLTCTLGDIGDCEVIWSPGIPAGQFPLAPGEERTFSGTYSKDCPPADVICSDTATIVCFDPFGNRVSDTKSATCKIPKAEFNVSLVKDCVPAATSADPISYTLRVQNTSPGNCLSPLKCTLGDQSNCPADWNPDLPLGEFELSPGQQLNFAGLYSQKCPPEDVNCVNVATLTCTDVNGNPHTASDEAICAIPKSGVEVQVDKSCVSAPSPTDPITYSIKVTNPTNAQECPEKLSCTITDSADCNIIWNNLPLPGVPFEMQPGETKEFTGSYAVDCQHDAITCNNTVTVECTDVTGIKTATATDNASCNIPECRNEEICRTPGYWGTHAAEKLDKNGNIKSNNVTQAVIDQVDCFEVCGETIRNTEVGSGDSAVEAICVNMKEGSHLQLIRQMTAAALNCIVSGGGANCSGVSIGDIYAECDLLCQGTPAPGSTLTVQNCKDAIDCFNNGGIPDEDLPGYCQTGTCAGTNIPCKAGLDMRNCPASSMWICEPLEDTCHDRELCETPVDELKDVLCNPGSAGSSTQCNAANKNKCWVEDEITGNTCANPGNPCPVAPNPECAGATCATFIPCDTDTWCGGNGVCAKVAEGGGVCVDALTPCASLTDCLTSADCPDGLCIIETCCDVPKCAPKSIWCSVPRPAAPVAAVTTGPTIGK